MRTVSRHVVALIAATILVATVWQLWDSRPTTATISNVARGHASSDVVSSIAWLGCLVLALGLLQSTLLIATRRAPIRPRPIRHLWSARPTPRTHQALLGGGYGNRAFPLIVKPHALEVADLTGNADLAQHALEPMPETIPNQEFAAVTPSGALGPAISLLGPVTIRGVEQNGRRLRGATRELLCYLALHPEGGHRDQITDALWPELPPDQARNRLWRAVAETRGHFGDAVLGRDRDRYRLNRDQISIDIDRLHYLLEALNRGENSEEDLPLLEQALGLFTGEPLAGSDFPWAEGDQRHLHAVHLGLLEQRARALLAIGQPTAALASAKEGLATEPFNERLACLAMQAEAVLGLRSAVINRYERLTKTLDEQLGLQPRTETRRLYRQLLGQDATEHPIQAIRAD